MKNKLFIQSNKETLKQLTYDDSQYTVLKGDKNVICPLTFDTEYTQPVINQFLNNEETIPPRLNLTVQVKHPLAQGEIFLHCDLINKPLPNYTDLTVESLPNWGFIEDLAFIDYLKRLDFNVNLTNDYPILLNDKRPVFIFKIYAHFLIADISTVGGEWWHDIVRDLYINERLTMERRAIYQHGNFNPPYFKLSNDVNLNINGIDYILGFQIMDTIGLQGNVSLYEMSSNAGLKMGDKKELDDYKTRMDKALIEKPDIFKNYAIGDLIVYDVLKLWHSQVKNVYQSLDVIDYFKQPSMTMGSTVANLFESRLRKLLNFKSDDKEFYDYLGTNCTSEHLAGLTTGDNSGLHLLSKVGGGRAFNNNPTVPALHEPCIDMDLAGAYSTVMQNQLFPISGLPIFMNFKTKNSECPTLREFLKRWDKELINGLWLAIISTPINYELKNGQDYFRTWLNPKIIKGIINPKHGETKYFSHEFYNAQLTSHDLAFLNDLSPSFKNELLDNVIINSAIIYPKSIIKTDLKDLDDKHEKVFKWRVNNKNFVFKARSFYTLTMGDLIINELQAWREIYPKNGTYEDKLKNTLFKLFVNTTYGIAVSPFFKTANVVVGNNITAAVRRGAWCLEKACNGHQSITDGGLFPINRVLFNRLERQSFSPEVLFKTYTYTGKMLNHVQAVLSPLLKYPCEFVYIDNEIKMVIDNNLIDFSQDDINKKTLEHLQALFPKEPLFNQITRDMVVTKTIHNTPLIEWRDKKGVLKFEMKTPVIKTSLHGTANYYLFTPNNKSVLKMRSYTSKQHYGFSLKNGELCHSDIYNNVTISEFFHNQLLNNPHNLELPPPYIIEKILKPKDYTRNSGKWTRNSGKWTNREIDKGFPSWNILKVGLLRPCTLSQFQFKTAKQWEQWHKASDKLKRKHGYSFELFFIKENGLLDYTAMIYHLDKLISTGELNPIKTLTGYWHKPIKTHDHFIALNLLKEKVRLYQNIDDIEDNDFNEYEDIMNGYD